MIATIITYIIVFGLMYLIAIHLQYFIFKPYFRYFYKKTLMYKPLYRFKIRMVEDR